MQDRGFVRLECPKCGKKDGWLRCEKCQKADHFQLTPQSVGCDCGATYGWGNCACGEKIPAAQLVAVKWEDGPRALADLEVDWPRVIALGVVVLLGAGGFVYWLSQQA